MSTALGADYLVCSPYKFYGPHLGVLWGRRELLEALPPFHVRPAGDAIPGRFETGTKAHELLAGLGGTIRYLEKVGITQGGAPGRPGGGDRFRRPRLLGALSAIRRYESGLSRLARRRASVAWPAHASTASPIQRVPRSAVRPWPSPSTATRRPRSPGSSVSAASTCATATTTPGSCIGHWASPSGGTVRASLGHYNTADEIERLGAALDELTDA